MSLFNEPGRGGPPVSGGGLPQPVPGSGGFPAPQPPPGFPAPGGQPGLPAPGAPSGFAIAMPPGNSGAAAFQAGGPLGIDGEGGLQRTGPPWAISLAAGVLGLAGALVAWFGGAVSMAFICWVVAGPVAMGLLAFFIVRDAQARVTGVYTRPGWVDVIYWGAVAATLLGVLVCAYRIAIWVGRL